MTPQSDNETNDASQPYVAPFIRRLMDGASEKEILEASENLRRYLNVLYNVFLELEPRQIERMTVIEKPKSMGFRVD